MTIHFQKVCQICGARGVGTTNRCPNHPRPVVTETERNRIHPERAARWKREYRRNRIARYELAHGRCEACDEPLDREHFQTHHMLPLDDPHTNELRYLRNSCARCNRIAEVNRMRFGAPEPERD